jgi:hypothetical protein
LAGENERTLSGRARAEAALASLVGNIGDHTKITVIGGMVPQTLTLRSRTPHLGTADLDLLLDVALRYDRDEDDFGWLQIALDSAGFTRIEQSGGWQWLITIEGKAVVVEFMCDVPDSQGLTIALPGAPQVAALNFAGPAPALQDAVEIQLQRGLGLPAVQVRFAGLGGYLLAKATAVVSRGLDKDFYDFAFVILNNDFGGPTQAGRDAASALPRNTTHDYTETIRQAVKLFDKVGAQGVTAFVREMQTAGDSTSSDILAQDAVAAVGLFFGAYIQGR